MSSTLLISVTKLLRYSTCQHCRLHGRI